MNSCFTVVFIFKTSYRERFSRYCLVFFCFFFGGGSFLPAHIHPSIFLLLLSPSSSTFFFLFPLHRSEIERRSRFLSSLSPLPPIPPFPLCLPPLTALSLPSSSSLPLHRAVYKVDTTKKKFLMKKNDSWFPNVGE